MVETFWRWCRAQCPRTELLPKSPLAKALNYALERRSGLEVFVDNPEVAIDTNHLERAVRPIPLGKRNWLFTSSEVGAQRVGIIQSLLVTCRLHAVDSWDRSKCGNSSLHTRAGLSRGAQCSGSGGVQ